jgi:FlaA1/EpsC-like NDP-sugar epimerase
MTISEASQLILQAGAVGDGGEIFVLDMGEPINIRYLAEQMILLSGKKPDKDIAIHYIGLRPGEKLHEELFHEAEDLMPTPYPKLLLAQHREVAWSQFFASLETLRHACETHDEQSIKAFLGELLSEVQHGFGKPERPKMVHG